MCRIHRRVIKLEALAVTTHEHDMAPIVCCYLICNSTCPYIKVLTDGHDGRPLTRLNFLRRHILKHDAIYVDRMGQILHSITVDTFESVEACVFEWLMVLCWKSSNLKERTRKMTALIKNHLKLTKLQMSMRYFAAHKMSWWYPSHVTMGKWQNLMNRLVKRTFSRRTAHPFSYLVGCE